MDIIYWFQTYVKRFPEGQYEFVGKIDDYIKEKILEATVVYNDPNRQLFKVNTTDATVIPASTWVQVKLNAGEDLTTKGEFDFTDWKFKPTGGGQWMFTYSVTVPLTQGTMTTRMRRNSDIVAKAVLRDTRTTHGVFIVDVQNGDEVKIETRCDIATTINVDTLLTFLQGVKLSG